MSTSVNFVGMPASGKMVFEYCGLKLLVVTGYRNSDNEFVEHQTATKEPAAEASVMGTSYGSLVHLDDWADFLTGLVDAMDVQQRMNVMELQAQL